jgi:hypothetical protein
MDGIIQGLWMFMVIEWDLLGFNGVFIVIECGLSF